jgi:hypothetical protein
LQNTKPQTVLKKIVSPSVGKISDFRRYCKKELHRLRKNGSVSDGYRKKRSLVWKKHKKKQTVGDKIEVSSEKNTKEIGR